nr:YetF domain-containing protein [Brevibacillus formosus]
MAVEKVGSHFYFTLFKTTISSISDVEWATIEVSGNLGYQLKLEKQPATKKTFRG